jgi:hypothetical protein
VHACKRRAHHASQRVGRCPNLSNVSEHAPAASPLLMGSEPLTLVTTAGAARGVLAVGAAAVVQHKNSHYGSYQLACKHPCGLFGAGAYFFAWHCQL